MLQWGPARQCCRHADMPGMPRCACVSSWPLRTCCKVLWLLRNIYPLNHRRMRRGGGRGAAAPPPQLLGNSVFWAAAVLFLGSSNGGRGVFFNFPEGGWRHADNVQGGGCLWNPPPPSGNPVSAPVICVKFWAVTRSAPPNQSVPIRLCLKL